MVYSVQIYLCVVYCKYIVLYFINHSKTVETIIVALGTKAIDALRPLTVYKYTSVLKNDVTKKLLLVRPPRCERPLEYYNHDGVAARGRARENVCYEVRPGEPAATCAAAAATMD